ncbi:MAG TPA: metallophosphoesterase [Polyangiaceae bacterium]|nr:metallophosphoesterase [Polyangiaceae bacterium]
MALIFHLSDLHIDTRSDAQRVLFDVLVDTLCREKQSTNADHVALVITGDVFDSCTMPPAEAVPCFLDLHARIVAALGCALPSIVIPGNHDRRWRGLVGPHRSALFDALHAAVDPRAVYVGGCRFPFLAEVVPRAFHGLPLNLVAYDSTYVPHGLISAGGLIRQEDLLHALAQLAGDSPALPLVVLVHHHLIPTPVTDVSFIGSGRAMARFPRWLLGKALPTLVANADREELTMTALGAGTALSTLHTFERPVLLLHGHKHFPTARLVRGLADRSGDVLIVSAGSAGLRERLDASQDPEAASLWPSFNVLRIDEDRVHVQAVSFPSRRSGRTPVRRDLANVTRHDLRWEPGALSVRVQDGATAVERDEARFVLSPSRTAPEARWDYTCERRVNLFPGAELHRYVEFVHGRPDAKRVPVRTRRRRIELALNGVTRYRIAGALRRTADGARQAFGAASAFEWIGLLSRYGGANVVLFLARDNAGPLAPFGSVTDLATGRESPAPVEAREDGWWLEVSDCAPRTMLRVYWPLGG